MSSLGFPGETRSIFRNLYFERTRYFLPPCIHLFWASKYPSSGDGEVIPIKKQTNGPKELRILSWEKAEKFLHRNSRKDLLLPFFWNKEDVENGKIHGFTETTSSAGQIWSLLIKFELKLLTLRFKSTNKGKCRGFVAAISYFRKTLRKNKILNILVSKN